MNAVKAVMSMVLDRSCLCGNADAASFAQLAAHRFCGFGAIMTSGSPSRRHLWLFGAGDFAFNLFWQSVSLYLLFFYIDVQALAPKVAGGLFVIGAVWDGVADLLAGTIADRLRLSYRKLVGWGAVPLALAFVAMFAASPGAVALALAGQLAFRTLYAFTNVPYAAWSTRLAASSADRALLAGLRMGFGAAAAALVALGLPWLASKAGSYGVAAALLAAPGALLLVVMAWQVPEPMRGRAEPPGALLPALAALARNRVFLLLNVAAAGGGAAAALAGQSVPIFFRYVLGSAAGGPPTLAGMAVASLVAVPLWTVLARRYDARRAWLAAGVLAAMLPTGVALLPTPGAVTIAALLLAMQVAFAGFGVAAWSLLPDAVDWGAAHQHPRAEATAFGVFALVQKLALAATALGIGSAYAAAGFVAGAEQTATSLSAIRWLMLAGPPLLMLPMLAAVWAIPRDVRRG